MNGHQPEEQRPSGILQPDGPTGATDTPVWRRGTPARRLLHASLALMVLLPVVIWLTSPGNPPDVIGEDTVDLGDVAPSFTVDLFGGGQFSLEDHLRTDGRPIVLNFWASWCVPCREEMPAFDAVAQKRPEVLFIGVAVQDSAENAVAFADEVAVSYPLGRGDPEPLRIAESAA